MNVQRLNTVYGILATTRGYGDIEHCVTMTRGYGDTKYCVTMTRGYGDTEHCVTMTRGYGDTELNTVSQWPVDMETLNTV